MIAIRSAHRPALALSLAALGLGLAVWLLPAAEEPQPLTVRRGANGEAILRATHPAGQYFRLEASDDMASWQAMATLLSPAAGFQDYVDSAAPYSKKRFYRLAALAGTSWLTGDHLQTNDGDVIFHPINHGSFVMSWKGKMIYSDPVGNTSLYTGIPKADLIIVTHTHSDHYSSTTLTGALLAGGKIVVPQAVYNSMSSALRASSIILANGQSTTVAGVQVDAVAMYNYTGATIYHPLGTGNGYVLNIAGRRIYVSGDSEDTNEMKALANIDAAFLCMNLPFTMSGVKAADAVRIFRPKIVYPYHYRNQDNSYTDLDAFQQRVGWDVGVQVRKRAWY
jgi:L-ascorbate metabolism protein UlaG (beta-lactamase superfamily)